MENSSHGFFVQRISASTVGSLARCLFVYLSICLRNQTMRVHINVSLTKQKCEWSTWSCDSILQAGWRARTHTHTVPHERVASIGSCTSTLFNFICLFVFIIFTFIHFICTFIFVYCIRYSHFESLVAAYSLESAIRWHLVCVCVPSA